MNILVLASAPMLTPAPGCSSAVPPLENNIVVEMASVWWRNTEIQVGGGERSSSRLLKNYSSFPADYGTRRYARSRSSAEPHVQLFVAGDASAERSSAARHPGHGG